MTQEERIEYLVSEVNRLNNFIAERDQKIEMLYEEKASLMDEVRSLKSHLDKLTKEIIGEEIINNNKEKKR